jgi:hypothetical protein
MFNAEEACHDARREGPMNKKGHALRRTQKLEDAPPGTQNITEVWQGPGVVAIGYGGPFSVNFIFEGGGAPTNVEYTIDSSPAQPLAPGSYEWSAQEGIQVTFQVDPTAPIKLVWIFQ